MIAKQVGISHKALQDVDRLASSGGVMPIDIVKALKIGRACYGVVAAG
jgi:hypothetical protein